MRSPTGRANASRSPAEYAVQEPPARVEHTPDHARLPRHRGPQRVAHEHTPVHRRPDAQQRRGASTIRPSVSAETFAETRVRLSDSRCCKCRPRETVDRTVSSANSRAAGAATCPSRRCAATSRGVTRGNSGRDTCAGRRKTRWSSRAPRASVVPRVAAHVVVLAPADHLHVAQAVIWIRLLAPAPEPRFPRIRKVEARAAVTRVHQRGEADSVRERARTRIEPISSSVIMPRFGNPREGSSRSCRPLRTRSDRAVARRDPKTRRRGRLPVARPARANANR